MRFAIAGLTIAFLFMTAIANVAQAAERPIVPPRVDQCSEIRGIQDFHNRGYTWRWAVKTPERGDCRKISLVFPA